jgi:hypothetical protein
MSPEQARGAGVDARSDLYSIGVILYEMLTGRLPFDADNVLALALKHITDELVPPSRLRPDVNPRLEAVCLRAMQKDPAQRYSSAMEMRADLRAAIDARSLPDVSAGEGPRPTVDSQAPCITEIGDPDRLDDADHEGPVGGLPAGVSLASMRRLIGLAAAALLIASFSVWGFARARRDARAKAGGASDPRAEIVSAPSSPAPPPVPPSSAVPPPPTFAPVTAQVSAVSAPSSPRRGPSRNAISPSGSHPFAAAPSRLATAASRPAPATAYSANHAVVSLGRLTTERVEADVVRKKLAEFVPRLNDCYRDALFVSGAPVRGTASIHLSVDSGGHVVSMVTAAELPPFARCADRVLLPLSLPTSAVESVGGVAEQTVTLTP